MPKTGEYEIILGTFNDNKFTWHHVDNYNDLEKAYKAYKAYVNSQLKYTDEELMKVWNTGRLDIELRKGNRLLNWVGVYSREVDRLTNGKESEKAKKEEPAKKTKGKDSADGYPPMRPGTLVKVRKEWLSPGERDIPYMVIEDRGDRVLVKELREYSDQPLLGTYQWSKDWIYVVDDELMLQKDAVEMTFDTENSEDLDKLNEFARAAELIPGELHYGELEIWDGEYADVDLDIVDQVYGLKEFPYGYGSVTTDFLAENNNFGLPQEVSASDVRKVLTEHKGEFEDWLMRLFADDALQEGRKEAMESAEYGGKDPD